MVTQLSDTVVETFIESQFQYDPDNSSGLNFAVKGGIYNRLGVITEIADTTLALTDDATNIVYINTSGTPSITSATSGSEATTNVIRLFSVVTATGSVSSITDQRVRTSLDV